MAGASVFSFSLSVDRRAPDRILLGRRGRYGRSRRGLHDAAVSLPSEGVAAAGAFDREGDGVGAAMRGVLAANLLAAVLIVPLSWAAADDETCPTERVVATVD